MGPTPHHERVILHRRDGGVLQHKGAIPLNGREDPAQVLHRTDPRLMVKLNGVHTHAWRRVHRHRIKPGGGRVRGNRGQRGHIVAILAAPPCGQVAGNPLETTLDLMAIDDL